MADPVLDAARRGDSIWLSGWLSGRQMFFVSPEKIQSWMPRLKVWLEENKLWTTGGSVDLWLRARLSEENLYPAGHLTPPNAHLPVELHVGFLSIMETEEELNRLRRKDKTVEEETKKLQTSSPSIERTTELIQPIDKTASRVSFSKFLTGEGEE